MTHSTLATPIAKVKTCADCPYFQSHQEPQYLETKDGQRISNSRHGAGWCGLFDCFCKEQHEQTQNCINSSDLEVSHELEDNLEFFTEIEIEEEIETDSDFKVGNIVKIIDRDEEFEEWAVFEVIEH